jgi:hypothetical protein
MLDEVIFQGEGEDPFKKAGKLQRMQPQSMRSNPEILVANFGDLGGQELVSVTSPSQQLLFLTLACATHP